MAVLALAFYGLTVALVLAVIVRSLLRQRRDRATLLIALARLGERFHEEVEA